ncbi:putative phosphosugar-binding protein [Tamaricihabitans halophyticus]|uniref:Putative phosphosugar-binding protein n=1 Tax=Tamaricihabitans halophyticus TaxID=1262583 RepID=A0A4R2QNA9_9PSEU|nr:sugar isomerase domain-containing protein [Tamaricihabitans halophyticus]TCP50088.1 putative phosphosugar-binding protein [Tamaricihabitans halophyticus]
MSEPEIHTEFGASVRTLLTEADHACGPALADAAQLVVSAVDAGGVLHVAGAGHSLAMVCETFYRAGGLAAVRPLWHPELLPLNDARHSSVAERRSGLAEAVLTAAEPAPPDALVVFSTSGRNPYPVEIAELGAARGLPVIAVTSRAASAGASARSASTLAERATVVLDTAVPAGDVVYPAGAPHTAAVSTILASYVWGRLLAEVDDLAARQGSTLPRWTSANLPGGDEANARLFARYAGRVPELSGTRE